MLINILLLCIFIDIFTNYIYYILSDIYIKDNNEMSVYHIEIIYCTVKNIMSVVQIIPTGNNWKHK